jgi:uncharacterized protein (TIGR02466 family)
MGNRSVDAAKLRRELSLNPHDAVGWHNLAAAEGDLGRATEAEAAARRAIALGIQAPETRLVLARALQLLRRLDEAEQAFAEALRLRPHYVEAHRDLAQLVWMRTARADLALARLESALSAAPNIAGLHVTKSVVLEFAGDEAGALAAAERGLHQCPGSVELLRQAAHMNVVFGNGVRAVELAEHATRCAPSGTESRITLCEALLAAGRLADAVTQAEKLRAAAPTNQHAIALLATAWRLSGDPRYQALYDYDSFVSVRQLDPPKGWSSLTGFLEALAAELEDLHVFLTHPLQQSVRGGSQLPIQWPELARPLIGSLFESIQSAVHARVRELGPGTDPLRSRNTGAAGVSGAWSVRLTSGGHHADHVHPQGWMSSACYIALPPSIGADSSTEAGHAGWIRFGQSGVRTDPTPPADYFVRPEPGMLVLFPSYMWHGVEPFESEHPRLTVACDLVPRQGM